MNNLKCTFCGAENNKTKISVVGMGTPEIDESGTVATASLSFIPDAITFERVQVNKFNHIIKSEPDVAVCKNCEKIFWSAVKELQKKEN